MCTLIATGVTVGRLELCSVAALNIIFSVTYYLELRKAIFDYYRSQDKNGTFKHSIKHMIRLGV